MSALEPTAAGVDINRRILRGSGWSVLGTGGASLAWFVTVIVLARLLTPADFGIVALAAVFLQFLDAVQTGGLKAALIQRRTEIEAAAASAFLFALASSLVLYAALYLAAPLAGTFFRTPELVDVLRVLGLLVVIRALAAVPTALLERELRFRVRAHVEVAVALVQSACAIGLAVAGFGLWSLVIAQLVGAVTGCGLSWVVSPARLRLRARSWRVLRELLRFARFVSVGRFAELLTGSLDNFAVGRLLGATSVGFYGVAFRLATFPTAGLAVIGNVVMLPALSQVQHDRQTFRRAYLVNLRRLAFLVFPASATFLVAAEPVVVGLLGARWEPAVDPLRILALYGLVYALTTTTSAVFEAANRPSLSLLVTLPNVITLGPLLYLFTSAWGTKGTAAAMLLSLSTSAVPKVILGVRILGLRAADVAGALVRPAACAVVLGAALLGLQAVLEGLGPTATLVLLAVAGIAVYGTAVALVAGGGFRPWLGVATTREGAAPG